MPSNGAESDLWYFGNAITMDGCQGCAPSASSASNGSGSGNGVGSAQRPGQSPTSEGSPPMDDPNASPGNNGRAVTDTNKCDVMAPKDNRNSFQSSQVEEFGNASRYVLCNGTPPRPPSLALSRGCQLRSIPEPVSPGPHIPRSMSNDFGPQIVDGSFLSMLSNLSGSGVQKQASTPRCSDNTESQPKLRPSFQWIKEDENTTKKKAVNKVGPIPTQQYLQDMHSMPAQEYRQFDKHQNTEEDTESDEEISQDPDLNKKGRVED